MRLDQLNGNKVSFEDYNGKYIDVEVKSASWKKTNNGNGNVYLSLELELRSNGKIFDKPVCIFSQKDLENIIKKIGGEKYPGQDNPDVSESDIIGLIFCASVSVNESGFASLKDIDLDDPSMISAKMTNTITNAMNQFTQQVGVNTGQSTGQSLANAGNSISKQTTSASTDNGEAQVGDCASSSLQQDPTDELLEDDIEKELEALASTPVPKKNVSETTDTSNNPFTNASKIQSDPFEEMRIQGSKADEVNGTND